ncbi:nudix hydrolase-like protein [Podila verticillata]|nr:nudix hydrolase-like protein [Haplosporangium bisporale]KAF9217420.1 nudix hydrolase-like protein [Podila verticillata]KAF9370784.1 nudix hydrolase-like protein [Podila verticillata]KAI9240277.1 MAG: NUDIX hydrolase domain-like protein [Podila humilis]KFH64150.1 hypothetical protein MVEG_09975 [Podila verticillata NRRL 6337]
MSDHLKPLAEISTTRDQKLGAGRWLTLHEVTFNDPSGIERRWEVCRRSNAANKPDGEQSVDAVDVIAVIKNSQGQATNVVLVVQYRPALSAFAVEFPSGLIDGSEEPATAAIRELQEETGFGQESGHKIRVVSTSVPVAYEPGLTSSCSKVVVVEIEMEQEELFGPNALPRKPRLEDDEWSLQIVILPVSGLLHSLKELQTFAGGASKLVLDSRLYAWAIGRELGY